MAFQKITEEQIAGESLDYHESLKTAIDRMKLRMEKELPWLSEPERLDILERAMEIATRKGYSIESVVSAFIKGEQTSHE